MAIGIGLHCWYCEHGPCNGECNKEEEKIKPKKKINKQNLRNNKIEKILEKKAIILMGLPLAGKTSWINSQDLKEYIVVSADTIKEEHPDYDPENAYKLHQYSVEKAEESMNRHSDYGRNIIMDSGSINNSYSKRIIAMLKSKGYQVKLVHVKTPLLVCLDRNKERTRKVPEKEIIFKAQKENSQFFKLSEIVDEIEVVNYFTNEHIFIDMDGVLAAQTTLPKINGEIDFVNSEVFVYQKPVTPVIEKFKNLHEKGHTLYILSAIPTSISLEEKNEWLDKYFSIVPKERRFYVNQGKHKSEMLDDLRRKFKLSRNQVTLVDDYHNTLYDVLNRRMNPMHISEFLTFNF